MADNSAIEWTDATWNPVTGCSHVSEGCRYCYAERMAKRLAAMGKAGYTALPWTAQNAARNVILHPELLDKPISWKRPRRIFVNSMSDLFHEQVPFGFILDVFNIMCDERTEQHTFQVLTKRPQRMLEFFRWATEYASGDCAMSVDLEVMGHLPANIWLGVSVENQSAADSRIPLLQQAPAAARFLSCEPLLGGVNFEPDFRPGAAHSHLLDGIHWVIVGGESGPNARPMHPDWARGIRDQCQAASVPFFFKQWGEFCPGERGRLYREPTPVFTDGQPMVKVGKKSAGRVLDGREWSEYPITQSPNHQMTH